MKRFHISRAVLVLLLIMFCTPAWAGAPAINMTPIYHLLFGNSTPPDPGLVQVVKLVSASSSNAGEITADWFPALDDITPHEKMVYTIHVSTEEGFYPSSATAKITLTGAVSGTVSSLEVNTGYYVMVTATDEDANESWSNPMSVHTVSTETVPTDAVVTQQDESQNPVLTDTTVTYTSTGGPLPQTGEFLVSDVGDGYLRKVVSAVEVDGQVVAQTQSASLNEIFQDYEIATSVKFSNVPDAAPAATTSAMSALSINTVTGDRSYKWPKSGLTLTDSNPPAAPTGPVIRNQTVQGKLTTSLSSTAASTSLQESVSGNYANLIGYKYLAVPIGTTMDETVSVQLKNDDASQSKEICKVELSNFSHDNSNLNSVPWPNTTQSIAWDKKSGTLRLQWPSYANYIDTENEPYSMVVTAYVDDIGDNCNGGKLFAYWADQLEMEIPVYVTSGSWETDNYEDALTFSGDFSVENTFEYGFEPELVINIKGSATSLESATLIAQADMRLANTLTITATGSGDLDQTLTIMQPRKFTKVFYIGGVPVVVRGEFGVNARLQGHIGGTAELTKFMEIALDDAGFGLQYSNGQWEPVKNFKTDYTFRISGEAEAEADMSLTLIPDLQLHFYEMASGRILFEPSLYAETAIHGTLLYEDVNGDPLSDLDYWFNYLNAGVALDVRLYAGLHILDYNILSYPADTEINEINKFATFHPVTREEGKIYSLPTLAVRAEHNPNNPPDTRAILIVGEVQNFVTPLLNKELNPWQKWTAPVVVTNKQYIIIASYETSTQHWFIPKEPGTYLVRVGGYSKLGWFMRQVAEVQIDLPDDDNDGMADEWELRWNVGDPAADPDVDGLSNLEEYQAGLNPQLADTPDSDNDGDLMPDSWEDLYGLDKYNPADAAQDLDNDGFTNLQEYLDGTDPTDPNDYRPPVSTRPLNDTGLTWGGDYPDGNNPTCTGETIGQQDCSHGRDATANDDSDGVAGFSFTKLDSNGGALDPTASSWSCVRDNVTGLIWEVKQGGNGTKGDEGLHDADDTYNWYNTDSTTNGGADGYPDDDGSTCDGYLAGSPATYCNTEAYTARVNNANLCGSTDWRMPSREELRSIVNYGIYSPVIDTGYFPHTGSTLYWSGSAYAGDSSYAWMVSFYTGYGNYYVRNNSFPVRLVRGGE